MLKRRIKRITIKNYRSITDLTVEMPDLMVLVGENGSGKSNFVDALRFLSDAMRNLSDAVTKRGGIGRIRRWSSQGRPYDVTINVEMEIDDTRYAYGFTLGSEKRNEYRIKREFAEKKSRTILEFEKGSWKVTPNELKLGIPNDNLTLPLLTDYENFSLIYRFLQEMNFCTIFPNALREPQKPDNPTPLNEHGSNFASALREIDRNFPTIKEDMIEYLSHVVPGTTNFRVMQVGTYLVVRLKHEDGSEFDLYQESDGTLRVLGLLLALYQQPIPSLLAVEEPELTIHPGALALLCGVIEEAAVRQQVIVTTHSPDLIARFDVDSLRVVERTSDGTKIDIIADSQFDAINEKLFGAGDILRIDGRLKRRQYE